MRHIQNMAKIMLATGLIVLYGYCTEAFIGWYSANDYEGFMIHNRMFGPYWYTYWTLIFCNGVMPQTLWFKKVRTNIPLLFLHLADREHRHVARALRDRRDQPEPRLPALVVGHVRGHDVGLDDLRRHARAFRVAIFLFVRFVPMISIFEMRTIVPDAARKNMSRRASATRRTHDECTHVVEQTRQSTLVGLMAEFDSATALVSAAAQGARGRLHEDRRLLAVPDRGAQRGAEAAAQNAAAGRAHRRHRRHGSRGYGLEYWASVIAYPLNIGGRPFH